MTLKAAHGPIRFAAGGRQASTGLVRVLLRAQVLSHLVNQLGLYTSQF